MRRGEVRWAQLGPVVGHEQDGHRPVLIVSDDRYTTSRRLAIVFPLTTSDRIKAPVSIELPSVTSATGRRSFALTGQVRTLAVQRLGGVLAEVTDRELGSCLDAMLWVCGRRVPVRGQND